MRAIDSATPETFLRQRSLAERIFPNFEFSYLLSLRNYLKELFRNSQILEKETWTQVNSVKKAAFKTE